MKTDNRRSHARVTTLLPFQVRRIHTDNKNDLQCRLSTDGIVINESPLPPVADERLNNWLNMLNAKLDYLLSITPPRPNGIVSMSFEPVNISGSGMSLMTEQTFNIGEILEIRMVLQSYPTKILNLYGEVVRVTPTAHQPDIFTIGVQFINICESVQDEIVRFDFKKHGQNILITKKKD